MQHLVFEIELQLAPQEDYFDSVLLARIQKVMFTPEWKDGRPARLATEEEAERTPRLVKVLRLEGYEDALHNLVSEETQKREAPRAKAFRDKVGGDAYRLTYLARLPLEANASLLNLAKLEHPFAYTIEVLGEDGPRTETVDLVETFNLLVRREALAGMLASNHLVMTDADACDPERLQDGAIRLLRSCLDRFYSQKARQAESSQLEPRQLMLEERATNAYRVRAPLPILAEIKKLLKQHRRYDADGDKPLPRLHIDRSLCNPLLLNPGDFNLEDVSVSPPGLGKNEREFVTELRAFWTAHRSEEPYCRLEIHLLRNLPKVGVGFFVHSGFYPDFILWARNRRDRSIRIRFVDPHGLHHGGLAGNADRFDALRRLQAVSKRPEFVRRRIKMDGFLLIATKLEQIVDRGTRDWPTLEKEYPLISQEGDYLRKVLDFTQP